MTTRTVSILVFEGVQSLDVLGPLEVFDAARQVVAARLGLQHAYRVRLVAVSMTPVRSSSGVGLVPHGTLERPGSIDTLVVPGGPGSRDASREPRIVDWVRKTAARPRRVASVCTGTFVLAAAGLLDGRCVTTHWRAARELSRRFPALVVDPDPIFVRDGKLWTSAGVTAGMDLALALVEEDFGRDVALEVARHLVMFVRRPGGQSQFSAQLSAQSAERKPLRDLQAFIAEHAASADLSVAQLARRAGMSPRHFARAFKAEIGETPAAYVERTRVELARRLLETTSMSVDSIATASGFGTPETLRRAFARLLHVSPAEYRRRFRPALEKESPHGHRHSAVRRNHRARRHRPLRSTEPPARRPRPVRGSS